VKVWRLIWEKHKGTDRYQRDSGGNIYEYDSEREARDMAYICSDSLKHIMCVVCVEKEDE